MSRALRIPDGKQTNRFCLDRDVYASGLRLFQLRHRKSTRSGCGLSEGRINNRHCRHFFFRDQIACIKAIMTLSFPSRNLLEKPPPKAGPSPLVGTGSGRHQFGAPLCQDPRGGGYDLQIKGDSFSTLRAPGPTQSVPPNPCPGARNVETRANTCPHVSDREPYRR